MECGGCVRQRVFRSTCGALRGGAARISRERGASGVRGARHAPMDGPDSSYSDLAIHICWKVDSEARMEPPIQTEYLRSGGATTLIFMLLGASAVISLLMRSAMPGNMVEPPERTMLP